MPRTAGCCWWVAALSRQRRRAAYNRRHESDHALPRLRHHVQGGARSVAHLGRLGGAAASAPRCSTRRHTWWTRARWRGAASTTARPGCRAANRPWCSARASRRRRPRALPMRRRLARPLRRSQLLSSLLRRSPRRRASHRVRGRRPRPGRSRSAAPSPTDDGAPEKVQQRDVDQRLDQPLPDAASALSDVPAAGAPWTASELMTWRELEEAAEAERASAPPARPATLDDAPAPAQQEVSLVVEPPLAQRPYTRWKRSSLRKSCHQNPRPNRSRSPNLKPPPRRRRWRSISC